MKIRPVRTNRTDRRTDVTKLRVALQNFAQAQEKHERNGNYSDW